MEPMNPSDPVRDAYRRWGYLEADLDSLGRLPQLQHPELPRDTPEAQEARRLYCGTLAAEFMHLPDPACRAWVSKRMEEPPPEPDRAWLLALLARAELFEQSLQHRYVGTKRFSIEGIAALVPLLAETAEACAEAGAEEIILGTAHRGRLNLMANFAGVPIESILARFEDVDPESVLGGGDVVYHLGASGAFRTRSGRELLVELAPNPSHLEAVDPVVLGRARARQTHRADQRRRTVVPILLHGDAAFAGQGVASETLNFESLAGYSAGGTIHVIVNNLIGFTTPPAALHSSRFASDAARRLHVPIFHVHAADPEAAIRAGRIAAEFRAAFGGDVVVDLIGHRRWGHSEVDDPSLTQPVLYRKIEQLPPLWIAYAETLKTSAQIRAGLESRTVAEFDAAQEQARRMERRPPLLRPSARWTGFHGGPYRAELEVETGTEARTLTEIAERIASVPEGFTLHPKVAKGLEARRNMGRGATPVDWGMAEALAFGALLRQRVPVRLSGQDSRRGTFNQRHAVLFDASTESEYVPLAHLSEDQAPFEAWDSPLSEAGVLGFDYGWSLEAPNALVCWEAQFGDFANGAQIVIDQFIAAGEDKWGLLSGLTLLLPHGYEGQGPEHSSARLERFLQLAAEDQMQVCQPTTAAQYFHLLRRQALRKWRKPLVVMSPKSLLRNPDAASPLLDLSRGRWRPVIGDDGLDGARQVLVGTGKIVHELRAERARRQDSATAIVALEQLFPFPEAELRAALDRHPQARRIAWIQEEPANQGALSFVLRRLERLARGRFITSVKRAASASPATGSRRAHRIEQETLLALAFGPDGPGAARPGEAGEEAALA